MHEDGLTRYEGWSLKEHVLFLRYSCGLTIALYVG